MGNGPGWEEWRLQGWEGTNLAKIGLFQNLDNSRRVIWYMLPNYKASYVTSVSSLRNDRVSDSLCEEGSGRDAVVVIDWSVANSSPVHLHVLLLLLGVLLPMLISAGTLLVLTCLWIWPEVVMLLLLLLAAEVAVGTLTLWPRILASHIVLWRHALLKHKGFGCGFGWRVIYMQCET